MTGVSSRRNASGHNDPAAASTFEPWFPAKSTLGAVTMKSGNSFLDSNFGSLSRFSFTHFRAMAGALLRFDVDIPSHTLSYIVALTRICIPCIESAGPTCAGPTCARNADMQEMLHES
jgi:hypothetical protein